VRLAYSEMDDGSRSFVFVHGRTCDQSHFTPQMEAFCRNYLVIAVDLRGYGQSDKPQCEYTLELFAGDIAAICVDLKLKILFWP
jgi:pimeloyl-ACP methyl ester carboxylesterase